MTAFTLEDLPDAVGRRLGPSSWHAITQDDIDVYADLTGDDNPIHVDAEAAAASPYGGRIAHGMLTLSMVVRPLREIYRVTGAGMGIVYGYNRIRFPQAVPAGARIRVAGEVADVTEVAGGYQATLLLTFEVEGATKPAVVAELVLRHYR
ncbi:acyl dehydratase [Microbacterium sp. AK009]|uniref:MaoC family dehydratase n=1 Tax=Microbacterium sp. AK009 TaxID=2723068 RepID=UPI0015CCB3CC|nr:MaoC family dehydratase [Microbacterium sp. AK009]NYF16820.1 acyl dehydratase [Microbacterium sp. AK009]